MCSIRGFLILILISSIFIIAAQATQSSFRERAKEYCKLARSCKTRDAADVDNRKLTRISDLSEDQPNGYVIRFVFYVMAKPGQYAHILLSPIEDPVVHKDSAYEIAIDNVIGGQFSAGIARKWGSDSLKYVNTTRLLREDEPIQFLIEITNAGDIRVYSEHESDIPFIEYKDETLLPIRYVGFKSLYNPVTYFFDCKGSHAVEFHDSRTSCRYGQTNESDFQGFYKISDLTGARTDGYLINFPLYIQAEELILILLTKQAMANEKDAEYEFDLGAVENLVNEENDQFVFFKQITITVT